MIVYHRPTAEFILFCSANLYAGIKFKICKNRKKFVLQIYVDLSMCVHCCCELSIIGCFFVFCVNNSNQKEFLFKTYKNDRAGNKKYN